MSERIRVGVIGCGAISGRYLQTSRMFPILEMAACADLDRSAVAEKKAAEFGVPTGAEVEELLADKSIDIVLNLTVPKVHLAGDAGGAGGGKECLPGKAAGGDAGGWAGDSPAGEKEEAASRLCAGYVSGMGTANGEKSDRRWVDRKAGGVSGVYDVPGTRALASESGVLLRTRRGTDAGYGAVLFDGAIEFLGPVKRLMGLASVAIGERTISS